MYVLSIKIPQAVADLVRYMAHHHRIDFLQAVLIQVEDDKRMSIVELLKALSKRVVKAIKDLKAGIEELRRMAPEGMDLEHAKDEYKGSLNPPAPLGPSRPFTMGTSSNQEDWSTDEKAQYVLLLLELEGAHQLAENTMTLAFADPSMARVVDC
jgi:hypothetical protein